MDDTVSVNAVELRQSLGELLNRVYYQGITVNVKRRGKVIAKLVPSSQKPEPISNVVKSSGTSNSSSDDKTDSSEKLRKIQEDLLNNRF